MIKEVKDKHLKSRRIDTSGVLNTSIDTCVSDKTWLNYIKASLI